MAEWCWVNHLTQSMGIQTNTLPLAYGGHISICWVQSSLSNAMTPILHPYAQWQQSYKKSIKHLQASSEDMQRNAIPWAHKWASTSPPQGAHVNWCSGCDSRYFSECWQQPTHMLCQSVGLKHSNHLMNLFTTSPPGPRPGVESRHPCRRPPSPGNHIPTGRFEL